VGPPVNLFTPAFMGLLHRGVATPQPVGPPFNVLSPPTIVRHGQPVLPPPANPDATLLGQGTFSNPPGPGNGFWITTENGPNHDRAHRYIGGNGGTIQPPTTSASDPFFFLLHGNVDRLWAEWQRRGDVARLVPGTAYGTDQTSAAITGDIAPWDGPAVIPPWTPDAGAPPAMPSDTRKTAIAPSIVSPPVYDLAQVTIPVIGEDEAVIMQIPWYPPRPADFAPGFRADQNHFCLLARIEADPPWGMQTPEVTNVEANTRMNNNIAWKNVTVVEPAGTGMAMMMIMRNIYDDNAITGLNFAAAADDGDGRLEKAGRIFVELDPEMFKRWSEAGGKGEGIERVATPG
jgi:Common central domain of tyrosinase